MLEIRQGRMLMQRIGPLTPTRQRYLEKQDDGSLAQIGKRNPRAPESKGLWVCPFPLFEPFLASYQRELARPPRFKRQVFLEIYHKYEAGLIDEKTKNAQQAALQAELDAWATSRAGRDRMRVRKFWVSGMVWTHLGLGHKGASAFYADRWQLVSIEELARRVEHEYAFSAAGGSRPYSRDQFELFLGRHARIH